MGGKVRWDHQFGLLDYQSASAQPIRYRYTRRVTFQPDSHEIAAPDRHVLEVFLIILEVILFNSPRLRPSPDFYSFFAITLALILRLRHKSTILPILPRTICDIIRQQLSTDRTS